MRDKAKVTQTNYTKTTRNETTQAQGTNNTKQTMQGKTTQQNIQ